MANKNASRLGVGAVQFGMEYGIANKFASTDIKTIGECFDAAERHHIQIVDTAPSYGDSEKNLGAAYDFNNSFNIISKTPVFNSPEITVNEIEQLKLSVKNSLSHLNQTNLYGLLIHNCEDVLKPGGERLIDALRELKKEGVVKKIGFSIYSGEVADKIEMLFKPDLIQAPINIFDQRLLKSNHIQRWRKQKIEIHARSIFLQGLLFIRPENLPMYFSSIKTHQKNFYKWLTQRELSVLEGSLLFGLQIKELDAIIVGVNSADQLEEIARAAEKHETRHIDFEEWALDDEAIIDPSVWPSRDEFSIN
jgi:aryl-alcohol dehydrogenase-like predicted oxidoreductase